MPTHDIIDNRTEKLVDRLNMILGTSERAGKVAGKGIVGQQAHGSAFVDCEGNTAVSQLIRSCRTSRQAARP